MPDDEIAAEAKRRGIVRVRTVHPDPDDHSKYAHIYVVRKAGPRGGHTIEGPTKEKGE